MPPAPAPWQVADAFDLPEWLANGFTWQAAETLTGVRVPGEVTGIDGERLALDLLCADVAFPAPVVDDRLRTQAHQAWHYAQVLLLSDGARDTLAVPAAALGADLACEALRRFAKAVGVSPSDVSVTLRL
jgi:hypothetical protein